MKMLFSDILFEILTKYSKKYISEILIRKDMKG
jgi:hypothetical protein